MNTGPISSADGHFTSYRTFCCHDDEEAIVWAGQLLDGQDVELCSGERFVVLLQADEVTTACSRAGQRRQPENSKVASAGRSAIGRTRRGFFQRPILAMLPDMFSGETRS